MILRFLARCYFDFRGQVEKLHPRFSKCPTECAENGFNKNRVKKCEDCPLKEKEDFFKKQTLEAWQSALGIKAQNYNFEKVLSVLYQAMNLQELPKNKMSVTTSFFVAIYLDERNYHRDKASYEANQNR